jgi:hypothetical protein
MGTAVDIRARQPFSAPNDVTGYQQDDTLVQLIGRQPFDAPNDVVGYPTWPFALPSFSEDADPISNITNGGNLGSDQSAVSSSSYTFTTTSFAINYGQVGILISAADNINGSDSTSLNEHNGVTGGTGVWRKLGEYVNGSPGAANGSAVSVWSFTASGTNPIGTVFTLSFSSAVVEKASTMWLFNVTSGSTLTLDPSPATNPITSEVNAAADFGSSSFSGLAVKQRVWFRGLAKELNSATAITPSAGYTITGRTRSSNTANAIIVRGEWLIDSSTGSTSNPALAGAGDSAGLFLALIESITGTTNATLGALTTTGAGVVPVNAQMNVSFQSLTLTGAGTVSGGPDNAVLNTTLGTLTMIAVGDVGTTGAGSVFFWGPEMTDGGIATAAADLEVLETLMPAMIDIDYTGDTTIAPTGTGRTFATTTMRGVQVHIQIDLGNDISVAESLMAMVSFAKRGGIVGFALDRTYAFFAQMSGTTPLRGDTSFDYGSNVLSSWGGSSPSAGWRLYLASPLPSGRREIVQVASRASTTITTVDPIVFTHDPENRSVIVRHKYFFPFLRYISGDVVVAEPQGSVYRFDAMFEEDVGQEQLFLDTDAAMHRGLGDMSVTGTGTVAIQGTVNDTMGAMSVTGFGTPQTGSAYLNDTLGALTVTGQGTVAINGTLTKTLGTMTVTSAGHSSEQGTMTTQVGPLTVTGTGTVN